MAEFTRIRRIESRALSNNFTANYAAPIHDPLWFLTRQWQMGEFRGEDTGSVAFVEFEQTTSRMPRWRPDSSATFQDVNPLSPLERIALNEPFEPDLGMAVELGHDFADLLRAEVDDDTATQVILDAFLAVDEFKVNELEEENPFNPVDPSTSRFLMVCAGRVVNGAALYALGVDIESNARPVPSEVTTDPTQIAHIEAALVALVERIRLVFGDVGNRDPSTWQPQKLRYGMEVVGVNPTGDSISILKAHPDSDGEFEWFSFDVDKRSASAGEETPVTKVHAIVPTRVHFDGMPATRFWNFEDNTLAIPHIGVEADDLAKSLVMNFIMLHSHDWYTFPADQPVAALTRTNYVVVHDVFGAEVVVRRADASQPVEGRDRWTMFSISDDSGAVPSVADYFIMPPSAGPAMQLGSVLEDVRFGRDEMANMAWGIEHTTTSPIGEPRSGRERTAQIDSGIQIPPTTPRDFPLRYSIESRIPYNWIPLLPIQPTAGNPNIALRRGRVLQDPGSGTPVLVPASSSILNPASLTTYDIEEEELPRSGLRVERVVYRTRWIDGSTHLWVQRRRKAGAGESQANLKFDQALSEEG